MSKLHTTGTHMLRSAIASLLCLLLTAPAGFAQQAVVISAERPGGFVFIRPYRAATIPPINLRNSVRIQDLIRGGKLYLTAQDTIALALENNIDLESDRYNPLIGIWQVERAEAGGALPGVPSGTSQAATVASGQGVAGSQAAAGVNSNGTNSSSGNTVGATISQIGPVTPTLDPVIQSVSSFSHISTPQSNTVQTEVTNWIQNKRNYTDSISEGLITGGQITLTYNDSYLNENVPSDLLNPSNGTVAQLSFRHNFLQGFGIAVNSRTITVAKANLRIDDLTFKNQVMSVLANVLNLYYGLVADYEDVRAKATAVDVARTFYENNQKQVQIGTMAPLDVTTAESQLATSQQDLVVAQTTLAQQQLQLKNVISRVGLADPLLASVDIVPLDRIVVPEKDETPPLKDLIATALKNGPALTGSKLNLTNLETTALGTTNSLLPRLAAIASATQQGLSGVPRYVPLRSGTGQTSGGANATLPGFVPCPASVAPAGTFCEYPDSYFIGGIGTALGQLVRRNFPSESAGGFMSATLRNRQAQSDFAIDQLSLRQSQLEYQKDFNQVAVDVANQTTGLQQARVRYLAAVKSLALNQQLLDAEQKKFALGASTTFLVVQQQRDLATAQSTEVAALVAFSNAKVALDQTLGTTLETNNVSIRDAMSGTVARKSALPAVLPEQR